MMKSHRSNTEEKNLIEEGIDRIIKHNESNWNETNLKSKV